MKLLLLLLVFGLAFGLAGVAVVAVTTPPIWAAGLIGIGSTLAGCAVAFAIDEARYRAHA